MKKFSALMLSFYLLFLTACTPQDGREAGNDNTDVSISDPAASPDGSSVNGNDTGIDDTEPSENAGDENAQEGISIPEVDVSVILPAGWELEKSTETNRRGSMVTYEVRSENKNSPLLQEIQFFSRDSIEQFNKKCKEDVCFMGDYPTPERYDAQKEAFDEGTEYTPAADSTSGVKTMGQKELNDRFYFIAHIPCTGDSCVIREYTTFVDDTKVDVWVMMTDETQAEQADTLLSDLEIRADK